MLLNIWNYLQILKGYAKVKWEIFVLRGEMDDI
ncbi:hypothetical protein SAMN04487886_106114 [Clostridium sp. DSM 8431]|nr:hypothetical protein SAMN04487886_106114 [Clostridium sp. DSM 8431]